MGRQGSTVEGRRWAGRCADEVSLEEAQKAAHACGINLLAQMESAAGLANVEQVAQLTGFVLSTAEFGDQPKVINAASDLLIEVLGEAGRVDQVGEEDRDQLPLVGSEVLGNAGAAVRTEMGTLGYGVTAHGAGHVGGG